MCYRMWLYLTGRDFCHIYFSVFLLLHLGLALKKNDKITLWIINNEHV